MIRRLLDSDICIEFIRRQPAPLVKRLREYPVDEIAVSAITFAELQYGVQKSSDVERNRLALANFCPPFLVLLFDDLAATIYGHIRTALERSGTPIGPLDTLIAAHALSLGVTLVTNNENEFRRVNGLKIENWMVH